MIKSECFLDICKKEGYTLFTGTPCSYLKPFINYVIDDEGLDFVGATNEGDAVAIASGAWLAGQRSVVIFQNSGLGNAVNPLTSLSYSFKIPFIGITTLRGEPGGPKDEPQHELMGQITIQMLELMKIGWAYFPQNEDEVADAFSKAQKYMDEEQLPFFFVMQKGSVEAYELKGAGDVISSRYSDVVIETNFKGGDLPSRTAALKCLKNTIGENAIYLATTGKTGRELFDIADDDNNLYMVGSMGCALPLGIGVSLGSCDKSICVIDGDGALMMRLGAMVTPGQVKPKSFIHILLDNSVHDSTGGQMSGSETVRFAEVARANGYDNILETDDLAVAEEFIQIQMKRGQLSFVHLKTKPGSPKDLSRPNVTPEFVARRLQKFIQK